MGRGARQQERPRRVLDPRPFEIALPEEDRVGGDRAERRAAGVPDAGVRRVPHTQAAEPRPIRQVDVLIDHEEALVEPAERLERVAADHERGAAGAEHLTRRAIRGGGRAVAVLERGARAQIAVAGAVDRRRIA
jgi:hypothetical protein